jgi:hypothetical protein
MNDQFQMDYTPHFSIWSLFDFSPWWMKCIYAIVAIRVFVYIVNSTDKMGRSLKQSKSAVTTSPTTYGRPSQVVRGEPPAAQGPQPGSFCTECGGEHPADAKFCPQCGAKVEGS